MAKTGTFLSVPDDQEGANPTLVTDNEPLPVKTQLQVTAFGELVTGQLHPQIQGSFEYTVDNTDLNTNNSANGGTITQAQGMAVLSSSTTTLSSAKLSSRQHAKYRPGLGGLIRFTALFAIPIAGTEQLFGLADESGSSTSFNNGYMIGYIGSVFGVHRYQNDVLFSIPLTDCDDPLDGTGASKMVLDQTKINVYGIQFQYLGGGEIEYLIEDDSTSKFIVFHRLLYANKNTVPSVFNPNFHFTIFVDNKATTSNLTIKSSSYAYFIQGMTTFIELHQAQHSSGTIEKTSVTSEIALFTIRNKLAYVAKTNFIDALLETVSASVEASGSNNLASVRVVRNATIGGTPAYSDINTSDSIIEIDIAGTTVTGGEEMFTLPLAGKNDSHLQDLSPFKIIMNPGDTYTLAGISAGSATLNGSLMWRELF